MPVIILVLANIGVLFLFLSSDSSMWRVLKTTSCLNIHFMFLFDLAFGHIVIGTQSGIPDLLGDDWECGEDVLEFLTGDTIKI